MTSNNQPRYGGCAQDMEDVHILHILVGSTASIRQVLASTPQAYNWYKH